ncbi:hypothetical protein DYB28_004684 [Aphanomyces astaci]|uniref:Uncharacterized protein n=1 Tax=Aphanomyces astaci TaxID=112090 RepID=A0A9X8DT73_APHAT|nr:hypothetical protein DYB28_004684 [Aphanomyces astaci]
MADQQAPLDYTGTCFPYVQPSCRVHLRHTYTHRPYFTKRIQPDDGGYSSDDSRNSECSDASLAGRLRTTVSGNDAHGRRGAEIRRRGDFASGSYIGDLLGGRMQDNTIRVASTNFNKQTLLKLHEEIANWILANAMDVLFMADSDWGARAGSQVWKA